MLPVVREIERQGGLARTADLLKSGIATEMIRVFASYGLLVHVRQGWWATKNTSPSAISARRAGGRLACVSALAHYGVVEQPELLHIALSRSARPPLISGVVVHWSRRDLGGDRAAVSIKEAEEQARVCRAAQAGTLDT